MARRTAQVRGPHGLVPSLLSPVLISAGRGFPSFPAEDGHPEPHAVDTITWLGMFSEEELPRKTLGFDRGVTIPVTASSGRNIDLSSVQKIRMERKERARKRWQRKLARQQKGS